VIVFVKLIILGPPGVGKGTYSTRLSKLLGIVKISTGDILREEVRKGSKLGRLVEKHLKEGTLVPDDIMVRIVEKRIRKAGSKGFILDGFPRTLEQAQALDKIVKIDAIIYLSMDEEILIERLLRRRVRKRCGAVYNVTDIRKVVNGVEYIFPPLLSQRRRICDLCGGPLVRREDDEPEVIRRRLKIYKRLSKPIINYYKTRGVPFIEICVNREPSIIVDRIVYRLKELNLI